MSWHFLQAQEAASWEGSCLDGAPSALSRLIPTAAASYLPVSETASSIPSRSGTTYEHSTGTGGAGTSRSSAGDFPVRTSAAQPGLESTATEAACGRRWRASFARYDRTSHSWRTPQTSLLGGFTEFSETWPRWGWMRAGECSELETPEPRTAAIESGFWPTLTVGDANGGGSRNAENTKAHKGVSLSDKIKTGDSLGRRSRPDRMLTGQASNRDSLPAWHPCNMLARATSTTIVLAAPPKLNATFCEWLMGWPEAWSDSERSATDRFRQWCASHGRP